LADELSSGIRHTGNESGFLLKSSVWKAQDCKQIMALMQKGTGSGRDRAKLVL
ncbi:hypothetical protein M9458_014901, partial [Cirrhinus mrigala]